MSGELPTVGYRARVEWIALLVGVAAIVAYGTQLVAMEAGTEAGLRWLLIAGGVLVYEVGFLAYHLGWTRTDRSTLDSGFGVANAITVLRGLLFAAAAGFLFVPPTSPAIRWAPGLCYGTGAVLDFVDGRLARRNGTDSEFGARLDHAFDTLGFLVAPLVGVVWGRLPVVYLSLSAARYLFRAGRGWRWHTGRPVYPLPDSAIRRRLAAAQMAVIAVALLPVVPASTMHALATIAVVPSLAWFVRDWIAVSTGWRGEAG